MAQGFFYTPPPRFIGGRQPFAPALGQPQSGPVPGQPIPCGPLSAANLSVISRSWQPRFFQFQTSAEIAPLLPAAAAATPPPLPSRVPYDVAIRAYADSKWTLIYTASIAPILAVPPQIDNPPPSSNAALFSIIGSWRKDPNRPPPLLGVGAFSVVAPPSPPPPSSNVVLMSTIAAWRPAWLSPQVLKGATQLQAAPDTTPDAFSFFAQFNVPTASVRTSNTVNITGIDSASPYTVSGDGTSKVSINGAAFTASAGNINPGDNVAMQVTASAVASTLVTATLTIGGVSANFDVTTAGAGGTGSLDPIAAIIQRRRLQ
jgi:hypothetical protein